MGRNRSISPTTCIESWSGSHMCSGCTFVCLLPSAPFVDGCASALSASPLSGLAEAEAEAVAEVEAVGEEDPNACGRATRDRRSDELGRLTA